MPPAQPDGSFGPVRRHALTLLIAVCFLAGCVSPRPPENGPTRWRAHADDVRDAVACRRLLSSGRAGEAGLDGDNLRLVNWNVRKGADPRVLGELHTIGLDSDLVLLQESALGRHFAHASPRARHWSFAPGYEAGHRMTGVMTVSAAMPLARCSLTSHEPWLRSPKATGVTQYALAGSADTLVVVNVHAINFTLGTRHFAAQFDAIATAIGDHRGPLIVSGDFNTWRPARRRVVERVVARLGLAPVDFRIDRRKRVFGNVLDHVYARGLVTLEASTRIVDSSDHNPMSVRFARAPLAAQ